MQEADKQHYKAVDRIGITAILVTAAAWGTTGIFVRFLADFSSVEIIAGRLIFSLALIAPIIFASRQYRRALFVDISQLPCWVLSGLLFVYYSAAVAAFGLAPVADVALLISTSPLFILIYRLLGGPSMQKIRRFEWLGALLALAGVFMITLGDAGLQGISRTRFQGDLLALGAACTTAAYAGIYRQLAATAQAPRSTSVAFTTSMAGALLCGALLISVAGVGSSPTPLAQQAPCGIDLTALIHFFGLGILATAIPSLTFAMASQRLQPLITTTIRLSTPLFATLFALIFLNEPLSTWTIPGGIFILIGMYLTVRR